MKALLTTCLMLLTTLVFAQSADEKAIREAEKQRFEAQIAQNVEVLEKVLADDLLYTHSNGLTDTKEAYIQSIKEGKTRYNVIDVQEMTVRFYGKTAVINGRANVRVTTNGQASDLKLKYTDVYVKNGKQWQMVAWQSLRLSN